MHCSVPSLLTIAPAYPLSSKIVSMSTLLVLTNLPDQATAESLAAELVENRLAACVNILRPCRSIYRWQGIIETAEEIPLLIKTTPTRYPALEQMIRSRHPYTTPEIIALPVALGLPEYLGWIDTETRDNNDFPT